MKKFIIILFITINVFFLTNSVKANAKVYGDLDRIELYQITIDPRKDGTLDMHFLIKWRVLDSSSEGPLEWIKIGIPNYFVDELSALSKSIKKIKYYVDDGSYIRLDLDRKYYQNEVVELEFKSHQSRMYILQDDKCYYDYNPGWFDEIIVDQAVIYWNAKDVLNANTVTIENGYFKWESRLGHSQTIKTKITYNQSTFNGLDKDAQFTNKYMSPKHIVLGIILPLTLIFAFVIIVLIIAKKNQDPYMSNRGFFVRYHYYGFHHRYYRSGVDKKGARIVNPTNIYTGTGGSSGGGCACACACACAGGGRAGCSVKDFYNINLESKKIEKVLKENNK